MVGRNLVLRDPAFLALLASSSDVPLVTTTSTPGTPYADYNPNLETVGEIASITNFGADSTGDLTSNPGSTTNPSVVRDDLNAPGGKAFQFFRCSRPGAVGQALQGPFSDGPYANTVFAAVVRVNRFPRGDMPGETNATGDAFNNLWDGDGSANRMSLGIDASSGGGIENAWGLTTGGTLRSDEEIAAEQSKWVRVVGIFGVGAQLYVERVFRAGGSSGSDTADGFTIGARYDGAQGTSVDFARIVLWADGTRVDEARQWLEENYDFAPVPPANPIHHWSPWHQDGFGAQTTLIDRGYGGVDLAATDISVVSDPDNPEQRVFSFNGSTSKAVGTIDLTASPEIAFSILARATTTKRQLLVGSSAVDANPSNNDFWHLGIDENDVFRRNFGSNVDGGLLGDLTTFGEFATAQRWVRFGMRKQGSGGVHVGIDGVDRGQAGESLGTFQPVNIAIGGGHAKEDPPSFAPYGFFQGYMSDILIYMNDPVTHETDATQDGQPLRVHQWMQKWRRLVTMPGATVVDSDAELLLQSDATAVSTWANAGSEGDFAQGTGGNQPVFYESGGPEWSAGAEDPGIANQRVEFDGVDDYMDTPTFSARSQPGVTVSVWRMETAPAANSTETLIGSNAAGTEWKHALRDDAGVLKVRNDSGVALDTSGDIVDDGQWHYSVCEHSGVTSHAECSSKFSQTNRVAAGDAGAEQQATAVRIGNDAGLTEPAHVSKARVVQFVSTVTQEQAVEWVSRRYPNIDSYNVP